MPCEDVNQFQNCIQCTEIFLFASAFGVGVKGLNLGCVGVKGPSLGGVGVIGPDLRG